MLRAIWAHRALIQATMLRDWRASFQGSALGALWMVLAPLAMIMVYTLVFAEVMHSRLPGSSGRYAYSVFLCAGLLPWALFAEVLQRCQSVFVENANLMKKSRFPRICLPLAASGVAILRFIPAYIFFLLFVLFSGYWPGWSFIAIPILLVLQIVFALGLGVALGTLQVFFRDVGQLFGIVIQFWFWLTPVVYSTSIIPEWAKAGLQWNPMYWFVASYQGVFLEQVTPDWLNWVGMALMAGAALVLGYALYKRRVAEMVDEL